MNQNANNFSILEEIWHAITHGVGLLLGIAGLVILIVVVSWNFSTIKMTACVVYGSTLIIMYGSSTLYHALRNQKIKKLFQIFDHASIYLLIAGSYTPIALVTLGGAWGWSIFGANWGIAIVGIALKFLYPKRFEKLSLFLYVIMGWMIVVATNPILDQMPTGGLWLLLAGGLFYSFGIIFYIKDERPFYHAVWHIFVLSGSICHYFMTLIYII